MDEPDETFTVTLSVPSHARWQPQRRLWQPNVDGMRVAVAGPYGHERVTAWQDGADAQRKNTAGVDPAPSLADVATGMNASIERALEQLRTTTRDDLLTARKVGRAGLPPTTLGLLFHAAEHSTRHAGQAISTAKILAGS